MKPSYYARFARVMRRLEMTKSIGTLCRSILALVLLAGLATCAQAAEYDGGTLIQIARFDLGNSVQRPTVPMAGPDYSNITNFLGQGFVNGGAALQGANTITRLVADDLTPNGANAGQDVIQITFSVANFNAAPVTARARIRFWFADGFGGGPGTYYNVPANVGFTFNPLTFAPGVTLVTGLIAPGLFSMPGATFWAGVTFDDNNGTTGATAAQMNLLGQGLFDPPTVGSSADVGFQTTAAGSFFGVSNPAGTLFDFGGSPPVNFGWELLAQEPVPARAATWGKVKSQYR